MLVPERVSGVDETAAFNELPHAVQYDGSSIGYFPDLANEPIIHGFSWDGLNYALSCEPGRSGAASAEQVVQRRQAFLNRLGASALSRSVLVTTTTGNTRIVDTAIRHAGGGYELSGGAVFTGTPGLALYTPLAGDCSWSVISGATNFDTAITGLAHSGRWEAEAGFPGKVVTYLVKAYGCDPRDLHIGITPGLGPEHHVIRDSDIDTHIGNLSLWAQASYRDDDGNLHLDQNSLVAQQYAAAGVPQEHISVSRTDTYQTGLGEYGHLFLQVCECNRQTKRAFHNRDSDID